ncbi:MAG TPA: carboxypeptidase-like regulatory domain-containing protein [Vicinamibacterales bacterium]|nr:carboxypeptidase-like regulatory domain-containing protein [Vicinamibacterales bacterium]
MTVHLRKTAWTAALVLCGLLIVATGTSWAQATGTVTGTIKDAQGGVMPGATVTLTSATRGTSIDVQTNLNGDFQFPNVAADTYTIKVTMSGFNALERPNVAVSPGDRVTVGTLTIQIGTMTDTVTVSGEAPVIQAASGERSSTIETQSVANLPVSNRNWRTLVSLVPGMSGESRLGSPGIASNLMVDGVVVVDTGCNCRMMDTMVETIAEVKVLTSGYQAEYGRASGAQITAVTKSGTNRFHGSLYDVERNSDWNSNSWQNEQNHIPKAVSKQRDWGYTIGGPIGKPGGDNKLFFFYGHEYQPRTSGGNVRRFRVPTALERAGDFSQSTDQNGDPATAIYDFQSGLPRSQCVQGGPTAACFQDGGVLGRIPQNRLYPIGQNVLNLWPMPNTQGLDYNYENTAPEDNRMNSQATVRVDYQVSSRLRISAKYAGQFSTVRPLEGSIPGFNDTLDSKPFMHNPSATVDFTVNPTTFIEVTYGYIQNTLGRPFVNPASNRCNVGLCDIPLLFPDAGLIDSNLYDYSVLEDIDAPMLANGRIMLPPTFSFGNRISNQPPSLPFPSDRLGVINLNRTNNWVGSVTKLVGNHTFKSGFYWYDAYKAENLGISGSGQFQGQIDFSNDSNNPLDTGFGYANAVLGIFDAYSQQSKFIQGEHRYRNIEAYVQDNWRMTSRFTLDYGVRFVHEQPQYDTLLQASNWFVDKWSAADAPALFVPGCALQQNPCPAASRVAVNPLTGASLGANTASAIGTLVPDSGNVVNGVIQAGQGIAKENYTWPALVVGPRIGGAYDVSGDQRLVLRGSFGLFYDRPEGNTTSNQIGNPPNSTATTVRYGTLADIGGAGLATQAPPSLIIFKYDSDIPTSMQWNAGAQFALPWASALDVSYVGSHGYNLLNPSGQQIDLNAPDFGAAYLPENQDPTLAASANGSSALTTDLLRPYPGFGKIGQQWDRFWNTFHSIQTSLNRRFVGGLSFAVNYTLTLDQRGTNTLNSVNGLRLVHHADGTYSDDPSWAQAEALLSNNGLRRHIIQSNFTWDLPDVWQDASGGKKIVGLVLNDWMLSGVFTAGSGNPYSINYQYQTGGSNVNLTGSPSYAARTVIVPGVDMGSGCSDNQYAQFNVNAFAGPLPGSTGLESGQNYLVGCPNHTLDLTLIRNFRLGGGRAIQVRADAFNAFNVLVYNGRQTTLQLVSPTNQTVRNAQYNADGSVSSSRLQPNQAGFGAVTGAQAMRSMQLQVRFVF